MPPLPYDFAPGPPFARSITEAQYLKLLPPLLLAVLILKLLLEALLEFSQHYLLNIAEKFQFLLSSSTNGLKTRYYHQSSITWRDL